MGNGASSPRSSKELSGPGPEPLCQPVPGIFKHAGGTDHEDGVLHIGSDPAMTLRLASMDGSWIECLVSADSRVDDLKHGVAWVRCSPSRRPLLHPNVSVESACFYNPRAHS
jgi:hypothetical protein